MTDAERSDRDRRLAAAVPEAAGPEADGPDPAAADLAGSDPGTPATARTGGGHSVAPWLVAVLALLVVPLALATSITLRSGDRAGLAAEARVVTAAELERDYGIKVDLVAVIAAGGLVDVRFTVIDKDKAGGLLHDSSALPELYVETQRAVLRTSHPKAHKMTILEGASYFLLYPNSGGLIQAGTPVSVVIDSVRLAPITAQS